MFALVVRRLAAGLVVLALVHLATFAALRALPGEAWADLAGDRALPPAAAARLAELYGAGRPWWQQYVADLSARLHGELGVSLKLVRGADVGYLLLQAAPISLGIGCGALALGTALGLAAGAAAARRRGGWADHLVGGLATLGVSVPEFVLATGLLLVFSLLLGWLPAGGPSPLGLVLPIITLAIPLAASLARLVRASLAEELAADFVRTARAKGQGEVAVVIDHALRPALGPVLAWLAPAAANVLTGSMVVEALFALPGLGSCFVAGALAQDWPVVTGAALLYAGLLVVFNLAADLALAWLDPRTRI